MGTAHKGGESTAPSVFERKQFTFYASYLDALDDLPEKDQSKTLLAIIRYALRGIEPKGLSTTGKVAFSLIKPTLDSGRRKAEIGKIGGCKNGTSYADSAKQNNGAFPSGTSKKEGEKEGEKEKEIEKEGNPLTSLWLDYPAHRREDFESFRLAVEDARISESDFDKIRSNLTVWKKTIDWQRENGRFIPGIAKWIKSGQCLSRPAAAQLTSNPFLAMQMEMEGRA